MGDSRTRTIKVQKTTESTDRAALHSLRRQGTVQMTARQTAYRQSQLKGNGARTADALALQHAIGNQRTQSLLGQGTDIVPHDSAPAEHEPNIQIKAVGNRASFHDDVIQRQQRELRSVRTPLDPTNPAAWSLLGSGNIKKSFPEEFEAALGAAPAAGMKAQEEILGAGSPRTEEQSDVFERRLRRLVRMTALGLMASHRATMEGKRDDLMSRLNRSPATARRAPGSGGQEAHADQAKTLQDIRTAAQNITFLDQLKEELEGYRDTFDSLEGGVLTQMRTESRVEGWLERMRASTVQYASPAIVDYFNERIMTLGRMRDMNLMGAALSIMARYLKDWRQRQIDGVNVGLYHLHEAFPFFAELDPEQVSKGKYASDNQLTEGVGEAFNDLMKKIDDAIIEIGSEDIHPFDLPEAVQLVKKDLSPELQQSMETVLRHRQTVKFWTSMGLTLLQTLLIFVPVVGPFLAAGLGAATLGADVEDMLDRYSLSQASQQPDKGMLGVGAPGKLEWALMAVQAALTIADLRAGWKAMGEWQPGVRPDVEKPGTRLESEARGGETGAVGESGHTRGSPVEPRSGRPSPDSPAQIPAEAHYPEGLVEFGLDENGARRSFRVSLQEDAAREAGIWMDPQTKEFVVVQGGRNFVETEWMSRGEMLRGGRRPNWRLVEHYHPEARLVDRLPSPDDFKSIMHWQTIGAEKPHEISSVIRYTDPQTHIEFTSRFGHSPGDARPFWVEYRSPDGRWTTRRFREPPWNTGSEYSRFVEGFGGVSTQKSSTGVPSPRATATKGETGSRGTRTQKVEPYEKSLREPPEMRAEAENLAAEIKRRSLPEGTKIKPVRIERTEAGRAQSAAVTPKESPVAMEFEFDITFKDGPRVKVDGIEYVAPNKYFFREHKEVMTIWERSHYARAQAIPEIDAMLHRHAEAFLLAKKQGCLGFRYSTGSSDLSTLLAERISLMPRRLREGLHPPD